MNSSVYFAQTAAMSLYKWIRLCFFNLLLVSALGVLMRYKISFSLPFVDQKNLLHSHSHFAFTGWATQALLVLLVYYLQKKDLQNVFKKYQYLLWLNLICAYGMLVSFIVQGYGFFSISFSTISIFVAYIFAVSYWKDLNKIADGGSVHLWLKASLLFNVISSLGAFTLAALMALKLANQKLYLGSVYYFLHFQYNGWFFFACMGLFIYAAKLHKARGGHTIFWFMAASCGPAYLLSVLWAAINPVIYGIVVIASLVQSAGWILFVKLLLQQKPSLKENFKKTSGIILKLSLIACCIKIILQQFSVIPFLSTLAFGFRPIIIGYLHLVLLGVISLFLVGYMINTQMIAGNRGSFRAIAIFVGGIFLNEILLMMQGVTAITGSFVPHLNEGLLMAALLLFTGLLALNLSLHKPGSSIGLSSDTNKD